ncbi:MAG: response regulator receiver sensor signal transduction histidine kinase [Herbinix sp.]|jgi:signal transduction histidine kinase|nr:response regulator receiver sensor signal transduction histidine kinase [Herbinix sp.]
MRDSSREFEILIVDDTPSQIHLVAMILKEAGYKVRVLVEGNRLFEVIENKVPDLILMDIMMPEINGIDLCRRIKNNSIYKSIPIIFLTAITDSEIIINAFSAGAQDYVSKPVNPKELLARVDVHVQLKCKTENLEEAYKEIESFNHMVCHDLKSPLWAIKNLINFINDDMAVTEENSTKRFLQALGEKASEAILLIEKLSDLSKVSSDPLVKEWIAIHDVFEEVYQTLLDENMGRTVEMQIDPMPEVYADRLLIKQVVYNAVSNAFKYTSKIASTEIKITYSEEKNEHVYRIMDNGVGFSMKNAEKLFTMFYRLHSKKDYDGAGTGLAIAKKIIKRHHGRVWVESEVNRGTNFSFTLQSKSF